MGWRQQKGRLTRPTLWHWTEQLFLIAGTLALSFAVYNYAARHVYQAYEGWMFQRILTRNRATPPLSTSTHVQSRPRAAAPSFIGVIAIPRLGLSAIVKEGVDSETLSVAAGHVTSTALPGEPGNVGVAAHRDTLFRELKDVRRDDEITLTTLDSQYVYRVAWFRVVNPTEVGLLSSLGDEKTLTLVTCYPFYFVGHAPKRFVVRARQVLPGKPANAENPTP